MKRNQFGFPASRKKSCIPQVIIGIIIGAVLTGLIILSRSIPC